MTDTEFSRRPTSPITFGIVVAIGVTLLFNLGATIIVARVDASVLPWAIAASQLLLMLGPTVYLARALPIAGRDLFRLRPAPWTMYAAAAAGIVLLWPIVQAYMVVQELYLIPDAWFDGYRKIQRSVDELYRVFIRPSGGIVNLIQALLVAAIVPAVAEESLFRGAVQRAFEERMPALTSAVAASILFVVLHIQPINIVPLMLLSLFLGLLARASRSLYPSILGHFLFNATMVGALLALDATGAPTGELQTVDDLMAVAPFAALAMVLMIVLVRWLYRRAQIAEPAIPESDRPNV